MDINADEVLQLGDICFDELQTLLSKYGLTLQTVKNDTSIPGSFWGDEEAGLIHDKVYARPDTPIHSILHESCHYICMNKARRSKLHTNAGGTTNEENAVCYLQILLADHLSFIDRTKMTKDMDSWGYSFRLGSTKAWFESDAEDAQEWLISHCLINENNGVTFNLRH